MEPNFTRYPRNLSVNFRKLNKSSLNKILRHYKVEIPKKNATQSELAVMAARVFDVSMALENEVVSHFADKFCHAGADSAIVSRKRGLGSSSRELLDKQPAAPGEQVAAKLAKAEEDGEWILGNVLEYDPKTQRYLVQDEDDEERVLTLSFAEVVRLEDRSTLLRRGDQVLAVFPETTSFYRAAVVKQPKSSSSSNRNGNSNSESGVDEVVVRFEDDEDEQGRNPARRVPVRFVLRCSDVERLSSIRAASGPSSSSSGGRDADRDIEKEGRDGGKGGKDKGEGRGEQPEKKRGRKERGASAKAKEARAAKEESGDED